MKKIFISFISFICLFNLSGQNNGYHNIVLPNFTLKSPEVIAYEKYGEIPVSEYTGTPSIDIPIHVIKDGSFEFPISLNYHATGIQVAQESTWVGLGWSLLAGGCISRIPVGAIDGITTTFDYQNNWTNIMQYKPSSGYFPDNGFPRKYNERTYNLWDCVPKDVSAVNDEMIRNSLIGSGERDVYAANFLGKSFKFSVHPITKQTVFLGEKNKFKIDVIPNTENWVVTDDMGIKYYFEQCEKARIQTTSINQDYNSTWYLNRIVGQDFEIMINYQSVSNVELLPIITESYAHNYPTDFQDLNKRSRIANVNKLNQQLYVSSIDSRNETVKFIPKSRVDVKNGLALDEITVISKSNQSITKRYKLVHDYFLGIPRGTDTRTEDYIIKRLKLNSIYQTDGTNKINKYDFTYIENFSLPYKTSFSQDYWGYYNGEENKYTGEITWNPSSSSYTSFYPINRSLAPSQFDLFIGDSVGFKQLQTDTQNKAVIKLEKSTIQRGASKNYITTGILESITYPTGGKTIFEFEPHTFSNHLQPCIEDRNSLKYPATQTVKYQVLSNNNDANHKLNKINVKLEKDTKLTFKITFRSTQYNFYDLEASYVKISGIIDGTSQTKTIQMESSLACPNNPNCDMLKFQSNKSITKTITLFLAKGTFTFEAKIDPKIPNQGYTFNTAVEGTVEVVENPDTGIFSQAKKFQSYGGGIRIKTIKNYDKNTITHSKKYNYVKANGTSSGMLIYPLKFHQKNTISEGKVRSQSTTANGTTYTVERNNHIIYNFYGNNSFASSPHAVNGIIGYSRVETESGEANNGKIIKEFFNTPNSYYDDFLFADKATKQYINGKMTKEVLLNNMKDTVSSTVYNYDIDNFEYTYMNINVKDKYIGPTNICGTADFFGLGMSNYLAYNGRFDIIVYPTNNYTIELKNKKETLYYEKNKVNKEFSYEYNPSNYQIKKITENLGDNIQTIEYKYPHSYTESVYSSMLSKNMVTQVIEEATTIGATLIFNKKIDYGLFGSIIAPKSILTKNAKQNEESRIQFSDYTNYGKPKYMTKDDITKVVYLWGYSGQYPIAEIKGATYTQITTIVSEATLNSIAAKVQPIDSDWALLKGLQNNSNLKNAHITLYKYIPLIGMYEVINPRGISTFYEYDSFNRLREIYIYENNVKKIIEAYNYNYINK